MTNRALLITGESMRSQAGLQWADPHAISTKARESFQEGWACLEAGEPAQAVAALSRTIEHAPDFTGAHVCLGIAHAMTSSIYPAIDHLETATQLEPDSFYPHFVLAQLNFKLRIPQKGYEEAKSALRCARGPQERKMLAQLLREERARERNGIARPWFNKPFSIPAIFLVGSGLAAAMIALVAHMH